MDVERSEPAGFELPISIGDRPGEVKLSPANYFPTLSLTILRVFEGLAQSANPAL